MSRTINDIIAQTIGNYVMQIAQLQTIIETQQAQIAEKDLELASLKPNGKPSLKAVPPTLKE